MENKRGVLRRQSSDTNWNIKGNWYTADTDSIDYSLTFRELALRQREKDKNKGQRLKR